MIKEKTFTIIVYSDPGHAWGKVNRIVLHNLGIANSITSYSYQRGEYAVTEYVFEAGKVTSRVVEGSMKLPTGPCVVTKVL